MHQAVNEIHIQAAPEDVMRLAFDLPRWPEFLPHYRWVRITEHSVDHDTVEMACWRTGIPLKWRSHLWVRPAERKMRFLHIHGPARGMDVEWELVEEGGGTRVIIRHEMDLQVPVIRSALGRWVVGSVFVSAVAGRTLRCLKQAVENGGK